MQTVGFDGAGPMMWVRRKKILLFIFPGMMCRRAALALGSQDTAGSHCVSVCVFEGNKGIQIKLILSNEWLSGTSILMGQPEKNRKK